VFSVVVNESHRRWIIFKIFKSYILSSLSNKASESFNNSAYYFFLSLYLQFAMHEMMSHSMFLLSLAVEDLLLSHYS
jgi:hypothetical protein